MTVEIQELKARAYDLINMIEQARHELALVNQEIANKLNEQKKSALEVKQDGE